MTGPSAPRTLAAAAAVAAALCTTQTAAGPNGRFPISVSEDGMAFVSADGAPFRLHGDTAWSLIAGLSLEEAERYLEDRAARGFNAVLVNLIEARFAPDAPADMAGEDPFLAPGAFDRPNPAYFDRAARIVAMARDNGLLVLLTPAYAGIGGGEQGWWAAMEAAGPDTLAAYGRFLATRFGAFDNIVWVHGGDFDPPDRSLVRAVADALDAGAPLALQTVHGGREAPVAAVWGDEPWLDFETIYTYGSVREAALAAHALGTGRPSVLIESLYENEHGTSGRRLRAQAWEAVLGGAAGHVYGANPVWHFGAGGVVASDGDWRAALDAPGARDMTRMAAILREVPCPVLVPDPGLSPVRAGRGGGGERASLASCPTLGAGLAYALAYFPRATQIAIDPSRFPGGVSARWLDPTGARTLHAGSAGESDARLDLAGPGRNARGDTDWLLALESAAATGDEP